MKQKTLLLPLLLLTGCQSLTGGLSGESQDAVATNSPSQTQVSAEPTVNIAPPEDIVAALTFESLEHSDQLIEEQAPEFDDLWKRIQYQISFEVPQNRPVVAQRNWYARHQSYLDRVGKRAEPFLYFIVEELEKREMPIELALLPIVESAFDPFAYSHGRASGMWQFIPGTATRFGLKRNWWYDGRRDVHASTRAALDYLSYLHKTLEGDWLNAIAAYNSGEGRVLKAIRKNKRKHLPTDFFSLDLPKETTAYVPKLLALVDIMRRPEEFGVTIKPIANVPQIGVVEVGSQIDLALAAAMADMSVGELHGLNPGYNRWATDPEGPHTLVLPLSKLAKFEEQLEKTPPDRRLVWERYKIRRGDSLNKIAHQFHTTSDIIQKVNRLKSNVIRVGDHLLIPVAAQDLENYDLSVGQRTAKTKSKKRYEGSSKITYTVKSGDNLWDISREYKVNIRSLAKWNAMAPTDILRPGQKLTIWKKGNTASASDQEAIRAITYRVRKGDSLARIASRFNVRIKDILEWNRINSKDYLHPGQKLKLFVNITNA